MGRVRSRRHLLAFVVILAIEVVIGLWVHDRWIRPYGGDALSVVLLYTLMRAFSSAAPTRVALIAFAILCGVEVAQYCRIADRLGFEHTFVRTVVGTQFDWGDFFAYALGAAPLLLRAASVRAQAFFSSRRKRAAT